MKNKTHNKVGRTDQKTKDNMKTIIKTSTDNIAEIQFKKGNKNTDWKDLDRTEQVKILNALCAYWELYSKFIKTE